MIFLSNASHSRSRAALAARRGRRARRWWSAHPRVAPGSGRHRQAGSDEQEGHGRLRHADFDAAKKRCWTREKLGKRAGLESHPVMARTYIHLGAVYLTGLQGQAEGAALLRQGAGHPAQHQAFDKNLTAPTVKDLFASVRPKGRSRWRRWRAEPPVAPPPAGKAASGVGPAHGRRRRRRPRSSAGPKPRQRVAGVGLPTRTASRTCPRTINALDCPYPDDTPPGKKLLLRCAAAANLASRAWSCPTRATRCTDYDEHRDDASQPKGWWQATIPKKRVDGKSLQFYFEGWTPRQAGGVQRPRREPQRHAAGRGVIGR